MLSNYFRPGGMNMDGITVTAPSNNTTIQWQNTSVESENVTKGAAFVDEADDAIWILTSTFIIFTMQSGM